MPEKINVILDISPEVRILLDEQGVNLYEEIQRELPSIRLEVESDLEAPQGSRDAVTMIAVTATLVSALTPIILRILNMITPPDRAQTWIVEEIETRHPNGDITIQRKRIRSKSEHHPYQQQADQSHASETTPPKEAKDVGK